MEKVRELTAARDAQTSLKSEIASLRALIESAEMRSAAGAHGRPDLGPIKDPTIERASSTDQSINQSIHLS